MRYEPASVFVTILCCLGYLCAADKFCKKYLEISWINEILFVVFNFSSWALINILNRFCFGMYGFLMSLDHMVFMGFVLLLFRGEKEIKISAASILITTGTLTENFSSAFLSCLALFWKHTAQDIAAPVLNEQESELIGNISLVIVILAVYWMSKRIRHTFYDMAGKKSIMLVLPLLAVVAVTDVANWGACYGILVRSGGNMGIYYDQIFSHAGFCVLTVLSMFAVGSYLSGMERICLEQKKSEQYHSQIAAYKMLEEQYSRSERLRHDLKNHIIALRGLLENKEWEKMEDYLNNMADSADLRVGEEITGNRVVDILLYQKRKSAEEKNIIWECDAQVPKICSINEFDLCVLFGNILDNAAEACERLQSRGSHCHMPPFINVRAGIVKKCFLLEVKNSVDIAEKSETESADRITGKQNQEGHGIGLLNVRDVVHKYNGAMSTENQDGVFIISVLVPLNDAGYDIKQVV